MNLLQETIQDIAESGYEIKDIVFIGSLKSGYRCTWGEFEILADHEYDEGFGAQKVAQDLMILFNDGQYMSRWEYDGSEGWATPCKKYRIPEEKKAIKSLFVTEKRVGWEDLEEINKDI